jgi:hypothetical protein
MAARTLGEAARAVVEADVARQRLVDHALGGQHGGDRQVQLLRQLDDPRHRAEPVRVQVDEHRGRLGRDEPVGDRPAGGGEPLVVAERGGQPQGFRGRLDVQVGDVRGQFEVDRELEQPGGPQHPVDLGHRVLRGDPRLRGGHLRVGADELVPAAVGERVVHQPVLLARHQRQAAADADDGNVLAVRPGDPVDRAQRADPVGDDHQAEAAEPGVAVGGVGGVELVAGADPGERL